MIIFETQHLILSISKIITSSPLQLITCFVQDVHTVNTATSFSVNLNTDGIIIEAQVFTTSKFYIAWLINPKSKPVF